MKKAAKNAGRKSATAKRTERRFPRNSPERTEYLLEVAMKFFLEKGFEGASILEMAQYARASKETFYARYPTKRELFRAAMLRRMETVSDLIVEQLAASGSVEEALLWLGEFIVRRVQEGQATAMQRAIAMAVDHSPELAKSFYELGPLRLVTVLAEYLEGQVRAGILRAMDYPIAARQFMGLMAAEFQIQAHLGLKIELTEAELKDRARSAVELFLRAMRAEPSAKKRG